MQQTTSKGISASTLKLIAIFGMTLDHIGIVFDAQLSLTAKCFLYALGGLTYPIMAYLLCEGYRHTKDIKRYALRLFAFALVAQLPYSWALMNQLNVLFTILLGLLAIHTCESKLNIVAKLAILACIIVATFYCDWSFMAVPMVLCYYYIKRPLLKLVVPLLFPYALMVVMSGLGVAGGAVPLAMVLPQMIYTIVGCTLTVPLLHMYNCERGRPMKYFFYVYYPAHIAVLGLIKGLAFGQWGQLF